MTNPTPSDETPTVQERKNKFYHDNPGHIHDFKFNYDTKNKICICGCYIDPYNVRHDIWDK
jgi:hypothetical protein